MHDIVIAQEIRVSVGSESSPQVQVRPLSSPQPKPEPIAGPSSEPSLPTLLEYYASELRPLDEVRSAKTSIASIESGLRDFSAWFSRVADAHPKYQSFGPGVRAGVREVAADRACLSEFAADAIHGRNGLKKQRPQTIRRKLAAVGKVLRDAHRNGLVPKLPEPPSIRQLEQMARRDLKPRARVPRAVTLEQFEQIRRHVSAATWPRIKGRDPADFWSFVLDAYWTYGFRAQDLVGYKSREYNGLVWESVTLSPECPEPEVRQQSPHGWLYILTRKTQHPVLAPISSRVRAHLDLWRGADRVRVLPNGRSKQMFFESWHTILKSAKVDSRITISGRNSPSLRRGCAAFWDSVENGRLTPLILGHRIERGAGRSRTTDLYYSNLVPHLLKHIESVPFAS